MTFEGWYGRAKPNIEGYVVPYFRFEITEQPLGKLSRNLRVLQKVLISVRRCIIIKQSAKA